MAKTPEKLRQRSTNKLLAWFIKNKDALNISFVAKASGVPHSTLDKWAKGLRPLPEDKTEPLTNWIKEFKK